VFAGWLFKRSSSGSGNGRVVLATVIWVWRRSSAGCRSGASLGREDVRKEGRVKKTRWLYRGILGRGTCRGYWEYGGDPMRSLRTQSFAQSLVQSLYIELRVELCAELRAEPLYIELRAEPLYVELRAEPLYVELCAEPLYVELYAEPLYVELRIELCVYYSTCQLLRYEV